MYVRMRSRYLSHKFFLFDMIVSKKESFIEALILYTSIFSSTFGKMYGYKSGETPAVTDFL